MKRELSFAGLLLFISIAAHSQQPVLGDKIEKEFEVTAIPDKWKNESAVIIGQKNRISFQSPCIGEKIYTSSPHPRIHTQKD